MRRPYAAISQAEKKINRNHEVHIKHTTRRETKKTDQQKKNRAKAADAGGIVPKVSVMQTANYLNPDTHQRGRQAFYTDLNWTELVEYFMCWNVYTSEWMLTSDFSASLLNHAPSLCSQQGHGRFCELN